LPLHRTRRLDTAQIQNRRGQVDIGDECVAALVPANQPRIADHHRHTQGLLVRLHLAVQAVLAVEKSVVAGKEDDGVVEQLLLLEEMQQAADAVLGAHERPHLVALPFRPVRQRAGRIASRRLLLLFARAATPAELRILALAAHARRLALVVDEK
jgi:hypothetical protein